MLLIKKKISEDKLRWFSQDKRGLFFALFSAYKINFISTITTVATNVLLSLKGVQSGHANIFFGIPIVSRYPLSSIFIGNHCRFRSNKHSNLIGITRPCIIATFKEKAKIEIGDGSGFSGTVIGAANHIVIGPRVLCGGNTLITDFDWHDIDPLTRHLSDGGSSPIVIEENVWLGANVLVLKGSRIGKNSIIGANSVVASNIPSNVVAAGNPCVVVKILNACTNL
jgi:acetyltransferase-like isoleucine patch superfamily enzyme